jgi:hypothetical protein
MEIPSISGPTPVVATTGNTTSLEGAVSASVTNTATSNSAQVASVEPVKKKTSLLPGTFLSKEDKSKLISEKKEVLKQVTIVKQIVFLFLIASLAWFAWIQVNLSESNSFLSLIEIKENIGQELVKLKKEKTQSTIEKKKIEKDIEKLNTQLNSKIYTRYGEQVNNIREDQIQWFDEVDENGEIIFGIADAIPRMQEYFNSRTYTDRDSILSGKHSDIRIENLQVSRNEVTFSVSGAQILGKVFFLNIEFIEMVNSFPFLKNGSITQFARQKNAAEDDAMKFSVRLERQLPDEVDPADVRFQEYISWLKSVTPSSK